MATQGIVSVVDEIGATVFKVIAGCDGCNAEDLASAIKSCPEGSLTINSIYSLSLSVDFGCKDCLVVMDKNEECGADLGDCQSYRETFDKPEWNPRWKYGTADHVFLIGH